MGMNILAEELAKWFEEVPAMEFYREVFPDGKKADCIRETGLAKHTVYKWWQKGAAGYEDDKTDR